MADDDELFEVFKDLIIFLHLYFSPLPFHPALPGQWRIPCLLKLNGNRVLMTWTAGPMTCLRLWILVLQSWHMNMFWVFFFKQLLELHFPSEIPISMSTFLHSQALAVFVLYLCLKWEGFSYETPVISLLDLPWWEGLTCFCVFLPSCYANTCSFWDSPSLRKEGSCWGEEGLTRDLGWKLCEPLAIVQPELDGLNGLWLMCSHQSHCELSQLWKGYGVGREKLTFQCTAAYIIFKILSIKLYLVWNYTSQYLLHGKSWMLTKDIFTKGKN